MFLHTNGYIIEEDGGKTYLRGENQRSYLKEERTKEEIKLISGVDLDEVKAIKADKHDPMYCSIDGVSYTESDKKADLIPKKEIILPNPKKQFVKPELKTIDETVLDLLDLQDKQNLNIIEGAI